MDPAVALKPQLCPLRAAGEELCHLLQDFVRPSEGYEKLGASGWELDGGQQLMEGVCSGGTLVRTEIQARCPEQLLLQGGIRGWGAAEAVMGALSLQHKRKGDRNVLI